MDLKHSIVIKGSVDKVFSVMSDVERWPEFLSSHQKVRIVSKEQNKMILEWIWKIKWRSLITIDPKDRKIRSELMNWPAKGLTADWIFEEIPEGTKMTAIHNFNPKAPIIGGLLKLIAKEILNKMSPNTLKALKERIEKR